MFGKNLKEEAEIDMLIQTAEDIMLAFAQKAYDPNFVSYKVLNIYPFFRRRCTCHEKMARRISGL